MHWIVPCAISAGQTQTEAVCKAKEQNSQIFFCFFFSKTVEKTTTFFCSVLSLCAGLWCFCENVRVRRKCIYLQFKVEKVSYFIAQEQKTAKKAPMKLV